MPDDIPQQYYVECNAATQPVIRVAPTWAEVCKGWNIEMEAKPMAQLKYRSKITYDNRIFKATIKKDQPFRTSMWDDEAISQKTLELLGGLTLYFIDSTAGERTPIRWYNKTGDIRTNDDGAVSSQFRPEWLENIELVCGEVITLYEPDEEE